MEFLFAVAASVSLAVRFFEDVFEVLLVALAATAGPDTFWPAPPVVVPVPDEVAPPPVALLVKVLFGPALVAVPFAPAAAKPRVEFEVLVLLLAAVTLAVFPNVAAAELDLVAFREAFVANTFVVALDLLELAPKLLVVELDLLALSEAEDDSLAPKVLLALACCILLSLAVKLLVSVLLCIFVSLYEAVSIAVWFREELMLLVLVLFSVSLLVLLSENWLFCPR